MLFLLIFILRDMVLLRRGDGGNRLECGTVAQYTSAHQPCSVRLEHPCYVMNNIQVARFARISMLNPTLGANVYIANEEGEDNEAEKVRRAIWALDMTKSKVQLKRKP